MNLVTAIAWVASAVLAAGIGAVVGPWVRRRLRRQETRAREQREMIEGWLELARFKCSGPSVVLHMVERGHDPQQAARDGLAAFTQSVAGRAPRWPVDPARVAHKTIRDACQELTEVTNGLTIAMIDLAKGGSAEVFAQTVKGGVERAEGLRKAIIEQMVKAGW